MFDPPPPEKILYRKTCYNKNNFGMIYDFFELVQVALWLAKESENKQT